MGFHFFTFFKASDSEIKQIIASSTVLKLFTIYIMLSASTSFGGSLISLKYSCIRLSLAEILFSGEKSSIFFMSSTSNGSVFFNLSSSGVVSSMLLCRFSMYNLKEFYRWLKSSVCYLPRTLRITISWSFWLISTSCFSTSLWDYGDNG